MIKQLLSLILALTSFLGFSQTFTWHDIDNCLTLTNSITGNATYTVGDTNPSATGINSSATLVSSMLATANNGNIIFDIPAIMPGDDFDIVMKYYTANAGSNNTGSGRVILRLFNSTEGDNGTDRHSIGTYSKVGGTWTEISESQTAGVNADVTAAGGYNQLKIIGNNAASIETFYFDDIKLNEDNTVTPLSSDATLATNNQWFYNNSPDAFNTTVAVWGDGTADAEVLTAQGSPTTTGNSSPTVLKYTRNDLDATTGILFDGGILKYDEGDGQITVRIYPVCNPDYGTPSLRIRTKFDGASATQIQGAITDLTANQWNEVSVDLTDASNQAGLTSDGGYNEVYLIFNQGVNIDTGGNPAIFYIDALQVPSAGILSVNDFELNSFSVYPNPARDSFQLNGNADIESVKLYTITGRLIKTFSNEVSYDISDLTTGIYLAKVKTDLGSKTLRIIKN